MINIAQETLGFRRTDFSSVLSLLMPAESLLFRPAVLTVNLPRWRNAPLLPRSRRSEVHGFGIELSPVELSAQDRLTSELLRTL